MVFELIRSAGWQQTTLHAFAGTPADGASPSGGIVFDSKGNAYGTTGSGGANEAGTVYELSPSGQGAWSESVLYSFCSRANCADGSGPSGPPNVHINSIDGATSSGGAKNYGTDFHLVNTGSGWHLYNYSFAGLDGRQLVAPLLSNHVVYGVTELGGKTGGNSCVLSSYGDGVVYALSVTNGVPTENILHAFSGGSDGCYPTAGLISDPAGNL